MKQADADHANRSIQESLPPISEILRHSFTPLFRLYVYFAVLLPSGSVFGVNVKTICFVLLLPAAILRFLGKPRTSLLQVSFLLAIPAILLIWPVIGQLYGNDITLAFGQYKEVLVTLASCWLAAVACDDGEHSKLELLRTILHAEVAACVIKMLLLSYSFFAGIPVSTIVDAISDAFGVQLMGLDFESALGRIQFVADGLIPLCFYLLLIHRTRLRIGTWSALGMSLLLTLSLIFTFSRYFWVFAALTFSLGMIFAKKDRFHAFIVGGLILATLASLPLLITLYEFRFSTEVAGGSDDIRTQQIPALRSFFESAPMFGHGFGSHTNAIIRSEKVPYEYEVQWYALAGQEGLMGLFLMSLLLLVYFVPLYPKQGKMLRQRAGLILILLVWLSAGFFNPMLMSSAAAMSYAFIRALAGVDESSSVRLDSSHANLASVAAAL